MKPADTSSSTTWSNLLSCFGFCGAQDESLNERFFTNIDPQKTPDDLQKELGDSTLTEAEKFSAWMHHFG